VARGGHCAPSRKKTRRAALAAYSASAAAACLGASPCLIIVEMTKAACLCLAASIATFSIWHRTSWRSSLLRTRRAMLLVAAHVRRHHFLCLLGCTAHRRRCLYDKHQAAPQVSSFRAPPLTVPYPSTDILLYQVGHPPCAAAEQAALHAYCWLHAAACFAGRCGVTGAQARCGAAPLCGSSCAIARSRVLPSQKAKKARYCACETAGLRAAAIHTAAFRANATLLRRLRASRYLHLTPLPAPLPRLFGIAGRAEDGQQKKKQHAYRRQRQTSAGSGRRAGAVARRCVRAWRIQRWRAQRKPGGSVGRKKGGAWRYRRPALRVWRALLTRDAHLSPPHAPAARASAARPCCVSERVKGVWRKHPRARTRTAKVSRRASAIMIRGARRYHGRYRMTGGARAARVACNERFSCNAVATSRTSSALPLCLPACLPTLRLTPAHLFCAAAWRRSRRAARGASRGARTLPCSRACMLKDSAAATGAASLRGVTRAAAPLGGNGGGERDVRQHRWRFALGDYLHFAKNNAFSARGIDGVAA